MSKLNPYTVPGSRGRTSHKRLPKYNATKRASAALKARFGLEKQPAEKTKN